MHLPYPIVTLLPKREQNWLFGHPWVYSRAIKSMPSTEPGELVLVKSTEGKSLGVGYLNAKQTIALRMLDRREIAIDADWFYHKLVQLEAYRRLFLSPDTTAYRWCYGESDGIGGLIIDRYEQTAVVQVNTKGIERLLPCILKALSRVGIDQWTIHTESASAKLEGVKPGTLLNRLDQKELWAKENGLEVLIPLMGGQKTGWFCDQRENRQLVKELVTQQKIPTVLNLFSYTGGFALTALQGGAERVINVDQDKQALENYERMAARNGYQGVSPGVVADVWKFLDQSRERFDLVIVDPPAFVKEAKKKGEGLKGYKDLFKMSLPKVEKGGFLMVYSCSHFVEMEDLCWILRQLFHESGRYFQSVVELYQGFDHPVPVWFQESRYLKGLLLKEVESFL